MSHAQTIFVSKLRKTELLGHGQVRQVFDVVNVPGLQVVCVSVRDDDAGEFEPISQTYVLPNGDELDNPDDALLAWDDMKEEIVLLDTIAQALLRHQHGLVRPLWENRTPEQKVVWITRARQFRSLAENLGLHIEARTRQ